ncbi:aldo/keto reductase [Gehongia tenuis]|uniref:Aldo/keto reductase n=1 Tax=Gehongia tenuis TaxID=2763655 RepID=A0A926D5G4_9FIRM|nr:aldo/keto reductase [Gehongia tenuis]MBC8531687.1 aldo/keto reductase [Gehongia tenuis]
MQKTRLGKTDLMVTRTAFGALPIQRDDVKTAVDIVSRAFDAGINFFDTARAYTDSEEKLGLAFEGRRHKVVIATKTQAADAKTLWAHLETSLKNLRTDYIDLYQLHNPAGLPDPNDEKGLYAALVEAKRKGMIRHFGITNHRIHVAREAAESGLYETVQFPFSYLSQQPEIELVNLCKSRDVGFIAMKALSGGLVANVPATFAFLRQFDNVVPIYGIQHMWELEQFLELDQNPPIIDAAMEAVMEKEREELSGDFCRSCGYCLPCPQNILIPQAARIYFLMTRSPYQPYITSEFQAEMARVETCIECGACASRCPYGLDTPGLLKRQLALYKTFLAEHQDEIKNG